MEALQVTWFALIGVLLTGYIILDGFDLGVGVWYLFAKKDSERKTMLSAILPYWDGNEVWLLTGGGAVFAAFPAVYASIFSGLYMALMLVLFALIFRAVSIEFRSQSESQAWKKFWDIAFAFGSAAPALLFGVAAGNIIRGLPLDAAGNYTGTFWNLLNGYSLLIGITGFAMFALHGALFLQMKASGELAVAAAKWSRGSLFAYLTLFVISVLVTARVTNAGKNYSEHPFLWVLPVASFIVLLAISRFQSRKAYWRAFLCSSISIFLNMAAIGAGIFPKWIYSLGNPDNSLTVYNSSSSALTLKTMLILVAVGMPLVLFYTAWVHRAFRGKADPEATY